METKLITINDIVFELKYEDNNDEVIIGAFNDSYMGRAHMDDMYKLLIKQNHGFTVEQHTNTIIIYSQPGQVVCTLNQTEPEPEDYETKLARALRRIEELESRIPQVEPEYHFLYDKDCIFEFYGLDEKEGEVLTAQLLEHIKWTLTNLKSPISSRFTPDQKYAFNVGIVDLDSLYKYTVDEFKWNNDIKHQIIIPHVFIVNFLLEAGFLITLTTIHNGISGQSPVIGTADTRLEYSITFKKNPTGFKQARSYDPVSYIKSGAYKLGLPLTLW